MKKYSTLLLSSTLLLVSLANSPHIAAQEAATTSELSEASTVIEDALTTTVSEITPATAVTESNPTSKINQRLTTQQNGNTLSIFYQRSAAQKNLKIQYAIWSIENGQDDIRWISAKDYQTDVSLTNSRSGQHIIHSYITIDTKPVFLEESTVNITRARPNLTTNISRQGVLDITVHNISPDIKEVLLPTWSNINGQDDIRWYTAQRQANGTYTLRVFLKHHQFNTGTYSTHLYTKDAQGKQSFVTSIESQVSTQDVPNNPKPKIAIENLQSINGKYQVTIQETETSKPIQSVQVATWSTANQSNIKWRTSNPLNGKYQIAVDFQEHQNDTGNYHNHVYVTYTDGSRIGYVADMVDLSTARLPVGFSSKLASIGNIAVTFSNVYDTGNINYAVWSDENGQDDIKWYNASKSADKTYSGNIPLSNHKGVGKYQVHAYQGGKGLGAFSINVTNSQHTTNTYPIGQCTWGAKELAPWIGNYWGNANQWAISAQKAGFKTGSTPKVGAVAVWTAGVYGHVAVVTNVESNTRIRVQESNYAGNLRVGDYRSWFNPVADGITIYIYPS